MAKTVVTDSADKAQVTAAEKRQEDEERDLEYILKEPRGRRWMYNHIYGDCHISLRSHVPGDPDSTAFNEGGRLIGEALNEHIRANHFHRWAAMMAENHGDE